LHSYEVDEAELKLVKNTAISNYQFLDNIDQLKQEVSKLEPKSVDGGDCIIQMDQAG
jgi:hypothetical protein